MNTLTIVVCGLLALPVGWFSGVLIDRIPEKLPLFDPVASVRVRGKYLAVHLGMVALFVALPVRLPKGTSNLELAAFLLLFAMLLTVSVIDIELFRLPDRIVLPTLVVSVPLVAIASILDDAPASIRYALVGAALYFGFLFLAHLIYPRGMGFGDVKLAAIMGLYVGWLGDTYTQSIVLVLWAMLIGFVTGSVIGLVMLVMKRRSTPIPFGPFLALGTVAVVLLGQGLVAVA